MVKKLLTYSALLGCGALSLAMDPRLGAPRPSGSPLPAGVLAGAPQSLAPRPSGEPRASGMPPAAMSPAQPVTLPSKAVVDRAKRTQDFFAELRKDYPMDSTVKNMLTNDPWLLNVRDSSRFGGNKLAIYVVIDEWMSRLTEYDTYVYDSNDFALEENYQGRQHRKIFQHMLSLGANDALFKQNLNELRSYLMDRDECRSLIDDFKHHFLVQWHDRFSVAQDSAHDSGDEDSGEEARERAPVPSTPQPNASAPGLSDDQKAQLVLDIFATIKSADIAEAQRLLNAHPWLVNAELGDEPLLFTTAYEACNQRYLHYAGPAGDMQQVYARQDKLKELFSLFLLKGADSSKKAARLTSFGTRQSTEEYLSGRVRSAFMAELLQDLNDSRANRQQLLARYPALDESAQAQQQQARSGQERRPAGPMAVRPTLPARPAPRTVVQKSFWRSWKPWAIGGATLLVAAGAWYYKYRYNRPPVEIDLDDEDDS